MKKLQIILVCLSAFWAVNVNAQGQGAGYALDFDGATDFCQFGSNNNLHLPVFTISFWIKAGTQTNAASAVLDNMSSTNKGFKFHFSTPPPSNDLRFFLGNNLGQYTFYTFINVANNKYHNISVSYNGNIIKCYKDGLLVNTMSHGIDYLNNEPFLLGYDDCCGNGRKFNGKIDEVRIWNRALTQIEIRNNMNKKLTGNETGLVAYYKMDEASGTTVQDSSPNSNTGTLKP